MNTQAFADRVKMFRKAKGWSREELGEHVGVSYHQVVKWESGRQGTTTKRLTKLYEVFGVTATQFWDLMLFTESRPLVARFSKSATITVQLSGFESR